jgi:hypothetical protein
VAGIIMATESPIPVSWHFVSILVSFPCQPRHCGVFELPSVSQGLFQEACDGVAMAPERIPSRDGANRDHPVR